MTTNGVLRRYKAITAVVQSMDTMNYFKQLKLSTPTTIESRVLRQNERLKIRLGFNYHSLMLHALHDVVVPWGFA